MDIIKIVGIGIVAVIIITIIKQYKPEFAIYVSIIAGIIIFFMESALANKVDLGGKVIIISLSIPILSSLVESVVQILP